MSIYIIKKIKARIMPQDLNSNHWNFCGYSCLSRPRVLVETNRFDLLISFFRVMGTLRVSA